MPPWYRLTRILGVSVIVLGVLIALVGYFFVAGEPGSVAQSEIPDPAWTKAAAASSFALLVLGLLVLLAPFAHRLLRQRRS
jgi:formate hydrogenlyase subunit 3/multisubunit Na+/H+ antiporter MnhD subunit